MFKESEDDFAYTVFTAGNGFVDGSLRTGPVVDPYDYVYPGDGRQYAVVTKKTLDDVLAGRKTPSQAAGETLFGNLYSALGAHSARKIVLILAADGNLLAWAREDKKDGLVATMYDKTA